VTGDPLKAWSYARGKGIREGLNIPEGLWLEKGPNRGKKGKYRFGVKSQLKVACLKMRMTPF